MKIENKTNIGEILRNARKSKGITARQLAKEIGMSANAMCSIELSKNTPSWDALFSLCDKLDLQIEIKSKEKTMMIEEAIEILRECNKWRRDKGDCPYPFTAKSIGEAIDCVVDHFLDDTKKVWHKVIDGDLPEDGQHILYALKVPYGFYCETIYYPEPPLTDEMDYWMEIPEIPKEE